MSDNDAFRKWYDDNKDQLRLTDRFAAEPVWQAAVEHCKQGEPVVYQWYEEDTGFGWVNITKEAYDQAVMIGNCRTRALFTHAMPKSATPQHSTDVSELVKDAARYRWLRAEAKRDYVEFDDVIYEHDADLDAAIDAAVSSSRANIR